MVRACPSDHRRVPLLLKKPLNPAFVIHWVTICHLFLLLGAYTLVCIVLCLGSYNDFCFDTKDNLVSYLGTSKLELTVCNLF